MTPSVAILMGGLATRIKIFSSSHAKSMIQIAARPFIDWQLDYLESQGIQDVVLCLGHLGQSIENHLREYPRPKLKILISHDGPNLLGTGGALLKALNLLSDDFLVMYGDAYFPKSFVISELIKFYQQASVPACMAVFHNQSTLDQSNVCFTQGDYIYYEKGQTSANMAWIDYGISLLSKKLLLQKSNNQYWDLASFFQEISQKNLMIGFPVAERFYEIGSYQGIAATENFICEQQRTLCETPSANIWKNPSQF